MRGKLVAAGLLFIGVLARADSPATPWSRVRAPTSGPPRAIGGYSAGCIEGAVALPFTGDGYRVASPGRGRVYGHPRLIAFLRELGQRLKGQKLATLAIGDLGQPRGGPAPTGHASHQTGLDVDIWFGQAVGKHALSMVDAARGRPSPQFTPAVAHVLELAAPDPRVDRIFINPVLKRALCQSATGNRVWLQKLRPWWGHADHFHVRLACPDDSPECVAQPPLPPGDGCDTLEWWFSAGAQADRAREHQSYASRVGASPELPERCRGLIEAAAPPALPARSRTDAPSSSTSMSAP
jgi:penicillin-insensitive murein endopeptidase